MQFETKPARKWKVTGVDVKGKRINLGYFASDNHLAEEWDSLNRVYEDVEVVDVSNRKAT